MQNLKALTAALTNEAYNSDEYQNYLKYKEIVYKNNETKAKLDNYRAQQVRHTMMNNMNTPLNNELSDAYASLILNKNTQLFLIYEKKVTEMLAKIIDDITDRIKVDLDFLDY